MSDPLSNPYAACPAEQLCRIQADIPIVDKLFLKSLFANRGNIQPIINISINNLINECKRLSITSFDPDNERRVAAILGRISDPRPTDAANPRNQRRASAPRKSPSAPTAPQSSSNPKLLPAKGKRQPSEDKTKPSPQKGSGSNGENES